MTTYTGADLLAMGVEQGPRIGQLLATINASPHDREQVQRLVEATRPPPVLTLVEGRDCTFHIEAGTDDERRNVEAVAATVAEVLRTPVAVRGLVMPDACPAGSMGTIPVGGVVTLDNAIAPGMHSADICCSVMMTEFDGVEPPQLVDEGGGAGGEAGDDRQCHLRVDEQPHDGARRQLILNAEERQGDRQHLLGVDVLRRVRGAKAATGLVPGAVDGEAAAPAGAGGVGVERRGRGRAPQQTAELLPRSQAGPKTQISN